MRGAAPSMDLLRPKTAAEALKAYGESPHALPLAGGTDFMVAWNAGLLNRRRVLDLSGVSEWGRIAKRNDGLRIGALVTHADIQKNPVLRKEFPLLVEACGTVGAAQIQNRGTIGGNIANASPAGDTFPPLSVYQTIVNVVSPRASRAVAFQDIFAGVKKTTLGLAELIESVDIPFLPKRPARRVFRKVGTRSAQAISKTVAAGLLWLGQDGKVEELRFAFGSVAPTVRRLRSVEEFVAGKALTGDVVEQACALLDRDISPIDDIRSTREYRLTASRNILRSFLEGKP